jgi:C4-dicarboxylate transporter, DctM subunit
MTPVEIGYICLGIMFLLLFMGVPVAVAMGLMGLAGTIWVTGLNAALGIAKTVPITTVSEYEWSVLPLFILMGEFCFFSGLSEELYTAAARWLGHLRGGLAMATIGGCAGFAAVSGSSLATAATMGTVALPEMKRFGYSDQLATGTVAVGGGIGILIPPSGIMVLYGIIAEQSIGKLFLAGFIPGVMQALIYMAVIYIICRRNPLLGPPGLKTSLREKMATLKNTWGMVALFLMVLGGIYSGIVTVNEAAGAGAFGAFILALIKRKVTWKNLWGSLVETCKTSAMIIFIVTGAMMFNYFMGLTRLPAGIASAITALNVNRYVVFGIIVMAYLFLGCIMDAIAMVLLTVPIFFPLMMSLGFDPIWFGIMIVILFEMAAVTPPVGMNVYVVHGIAQGVPMSTTFRGIVPFLYGAILQIILLTLFPKIALFLPELMR